MSERAAKPVTVPDTGQGGLQTSGGAGTGDAYPNPHTGRPPAKEYRGGQSDADEAADKD